MKNSHHFLSLSLSVCAYVWCLYKMVVEITKETWEKCEIEIIDKGRYFGVNKKNLEVESDVDNWAQIFCKCAKEKKKYRQELTPNAKYQQCKVFLRNDLVGKKLKAVENHQKDF